VSTTFDRACSVLHAALDGTARQQLVAELSRISDFRRALLKLRDSMRANVFGTGPELIDLERIVRKYDRRTRADGFHVLHDWDGTADKVNPDTIPVDVLHYVAGRRGGDAADPKALAIILDYHFMHVLALLSLRIWDEGDPDANLDRLTALLDALQGAGGSGQQFAANPETLLLIGTSHYELHERGYATLLQRVRTLNRLHRVNIALGHAVSMGCHLRFGFEATYGRDTLNMRDDNAADYPWLCFALATLMEEYARLAAPGGEDDVKDGIVEALLNGLSADARAFIGSAPPSLSQCEMERARFAAMFADHRQQLLEAFEPYRPSDRAYSPLSFHFNFAHNVIKGMIVDALLQSEVWPVALNDLLTTRSQGTAAPRVKEQLALTLMGYARANPHRIRGRLTPVIVYDPGSGREAFGITVRKLRA
jgi:hypothetical protein